MGGVEHLKTDEVALCVVVHDDAGLALVALDDGGVAEQNAHNVHFGVVGYFHDGLQYLAILLVR